MCWPPHGGVKRFLITIGDRTVGGLTHRDQMVGPGRCPVADCAVTLADYKGFVNGEAMAMGERTPLAAINAPASGRMAVAEAITNPAGRAHRPAARVEDQRQLDGRLRRARRRRRLYATVKAVGLELCPQLGISIPVGKDAVHAHAVEGWRRAKKVVSPVSLIVGASPRCLTCAARSRPSSTPAGEDTTLVLIDLGKGQCRMGGSDPGPGAGPGRHRAGPR